MQPLEFITRGCFMLAVLSAWALTICRKAPFYRPVAIVLTLLFCLDCLRGGIRFFVLQPARAAGRVPYVGYERLWFHVEQASLLAFAACSIGLAVMVFLRPRRVAMANGIIVSAWAVTTFVVATSYPELRQAPLELVYTWVTRASVVVQVGCAAYFFARKGMPLSPQRAALVMLAVDGAALIGPYFTAHPSADWASMRAPALLLWGLLSLLQGSNAWWWTRVQRRRDIY